MGVTLVSMLLIVGSLSLWTLSMPKKRYGSSPAAVGFIIFLLVG
jgi:hypothetical protein